MKFFLFLLVVLLTLTPCILAETIQKAVFAGGCFWCMESAFDKVSGVKKTVSGYTGGYLENPNYKQVSTGSTGHYEAVEVYYDSEQVSYEKLLEIFWKNVDPTNKDGQFCDLGSQYRSAIFVRNIQQKIAAEQSKKSIVDSKKISSVTTKILLFTRFYPAEEYHQNYYKKKPQQYQSYLAGCQRDKQLKTLWGDSKK